MVKVNNGWHSHSIDQVETMASQAASPSSSNSTVHGRHGASASPRLRSNSSTPASAGAVRSQFESPWAEWNRAPGSAAGASPMPPSGAAPSLAQPVSIRRGQQPNNPRRNSNPKYPPVSLSHAQLGSPRTPRQQLSPAQRTPQPRSAATSIVDPVPYSPHQNVREQDAIETLLFMSSPGNSANMKHTFPSSSSQPLPSVTSSPRRTALPSSQPRKSLPTARPAHHTQTPRHVGFEKSPSNLSDMDLDEHFRSPNTVGSNFSHGTPRRKTNGSYMAGDSSTPRLKVPLPTLCGLSGPSKPRPTLGEDDIEKMLDRAADDSDDSDDSIQIPTQRARTYAAGI